MYKLMEMEPPPLKVKKKKVVPPLKIDRTGESDPARYTGLKMGQVLDDEEMARALEEANRKARQGESLRPKLEEESFVKPFAGAYSNVDAGNDCRFVSLAHCKHSFSPFYPITQTIRMLVLDKHPIGHRNSWTKRERNGGELNHGRAKQRRVNL